MKTPVKCPRCGKNMGVAWNPKTKCSTCKKHPLKPHQYDDDVYNYLGGKS